MTSSAIRTESQCAYGGREVLRLIRKLVRQMLTAQILSALTVSLCLLIDNIMIGRYLGEDALAAYGLAGPILLVIGAIGSMLSAGVQVACSKSLGSGSQDETNAGYSSAIVIAGTVSFTLTLLVLLLRHPLARALGATDGGVLYQNTHTYLAGFIIGAPATMGALILVPFLQMAGRNGLLIAAVLSMTVGDVALDLLNVLVFHGGMFGMGLASSLSYYIALIIGGSYFVSRKCVFRFSKKGVSRRKITELFRGGVPTIFNMASTVVLILFMNRLLLRAGANAAVAAFSVVTTISSAANCISTGMGGVALTMSGILGTEDDRTGLCGLFTLLVRYAVMLGVVATALLVPLAPYCVRLFMPRPGTAQTTAILGLRLVALGLTPCCVINAFRGCYQGTGRIKTTELISVCECAVLPALSAWVLLTVTNLEGVWFYYFAGEMLTLAGIVLYVWIRSKRVTWRPADLLMLSDDFGVPERDLMEADIHNLDEVVEVSQRAEQFCLERGQSALVSGRIALCIEEMAGNTIEHGFAPKGRNHLSVRLQHKNHRWVLRFRDDCHAFDPINYVPTEDKQDCVGIRIVMRLADDIRYTYSLNLNNLTLILGEMPQQDSLDGLGLDEAQPC